MTAKSVLTASLCTEEKKEERKERFSPAPSDPWQRASREELVEVSGLSSALSFLSDHSRAFKRGGNLDKRQLWAPGGAGGLKKRSLASKSWLVNQRLRLAAFPVRGAGTKGC